MPNDDYILRGDALKAILGVSIYDTIEELDGARTIAENTWADGLYDAYKIIEEEVDAADVEPVRHGRWIDENPESFLDPRMRCSVCGHVDLPLVKWRFCPVCGAKMDDELPKGEDDDNKNL